MYKCIYIYKYGSHHHPHEPNQAHICQLTHNVYIELLLIYCSICVCQSDFLIVTYTISNHTQIPQYVHRERRCHYRRPNRYNKNHRLPRNLRNRSTMSACALFSLVNLSSLYFRIDYNFCTSNICVGLKGDYLNVIIIANSR